VDGACRGNSDAVAAPAAATAAAGGAGAAKGGALCVTGLLARRIVGAYQTPRDGGYERERLVGGLGLAHTASEGLEGDVRVATDGGGGDSKAGAAAGRRRSAPDARTPALAPAADASTATAAAAAVADVRHQRDAWLRTHRAHAAAARQEQQQRLAEDRDAAAARDQARRDIARLQALRAQEFQWFN